MIEELQKFLAEKSPLGPHVNVSRAIEIAICGEHKLSFVYGRDCSGGHHMYQEIVDYVDRYFDLIGGRPFTFCSGGDITIELSMIRPEEYFIDYSQRETIDDVYNRAMAARENKPNNYLGDSSKALLKTAIGRLKFTKKEVDNINRLAMTIAKLDNAREIRTEHVAEAIQYNCFKDEEYISAEGRELVMFGGIKIPLTYIDDIDIEKAITYLKSRIQKKKKLSKT